MTHQHLATAASALRPAHRASARTPATTLLLLRDPHDVAKVRASSLGPGGQDFAQHESHALALWTPRAYDLVVWEPVSMDTDALDRALECCDRAPGTAFVLRGSLSAGLLRLVQRIAATSVRVRVSLRPVPIMMDLRDHGAGVDPVADIPIIAGLTPYWPESAFPELVALVSCGSRRVNPATSAAVCGCALRTLQWRLRHAGLPPARTLLGWMLALQTLWRLDVLGWSLKRAASVAGMPDGRALSEYLMRHAAARPRELLHRGGFRATMERFAGLLPPR